MIYQELNLAPGLTVEENIVLGAETHRWGWMHKKSMRERAQEALATLDYESIPLDAPVHSLNLAQQQIVEIARALVGKPKVLIMDEPTSMFDSVGIRRNCSKSFPDYENMMSAWYTSVISLKKARPFAIAIRFWRDGESVAAGQMDEADLSEIIHHMGRS